jgi:hypothetical protein
MFQKIPLVHPPHNSQPHCACRGEARFFLKYFVNKATNNFYEQILNPVLTSSHDHHQSQSQYLVRTNSTLAISLEFRGRQIDYN